MEKSHNLRSALLPLIDRSDFLLVFLFGSFAKACSTDESDVDVAIMFEKVPDFYEVSDLKDQLARHIGREVDILVLNTASPIIRLQVLKYGQLIKKDEKVYNDYFVRTLNEYSDLKYMRREAEDSILAGRIYAWQRRGYGQGCHYSEVPEKSTGDYGKRSR